LSGGIVSSDDSTADFSAGVSKTSSSLKKKIRKNKKKSVSAIRGGKKMLGFASDRRVLI
jgi:ribosome-associated translation inhibitor RaiA